MTTVQTNAEEQQQKEEKQMLLDSALPKGCSLGKYTVVKPLGAGGFGITYLVKRKVGNIEQLFVIKEFFMKGCYRDSKGTVSYAPNMKADFKHGRDDFKQEAVKLQELQTSIPNIVRVNEHFDANGTTYYVMQYLDGGDLHKRTPKGGIPESAALSVITTITKAVEKLHQQRMLHLDIKPDNIVLQRDVATGRLVPILIDFGVAKHFDKSGHPTTQTVAKGASAGYAPPEQYASISTFAPTLDVYALGATLYFLLTGERPADARLMMENSTLTQQMLAKIPASVSQRTRNAIAKAMRTAKHERTQTAADFLASLGEAYTLPIGYVLHSPEQSYMITEVCGEADGYITYKAIPAPSTIHTQAPNIGNKTVATTQYYIYEDFIKGKDKRDEKGRITFKSGSPLYQDPTSTAWGDPILAWHTFSFQKKLGQRDAHGNLRAEQFHANSTIYGAQLIEHHSRLKKIWNFLIAIPIVPIVLVVLLCEWLSKTRIFSKKMLLLLFAAIVCIVITVIVAAQCSEHDYAPYDYGYDSTEMVTEWVDTTEVDTEWVDTTVVDPEEDSMEQNLSNPDARNTSRGDAYYSKWVKSGRTDESSRLKAIYYYENVENLKNRKYIDERLEELHYHYDYGNKDF